MKSKMLPASVALSAALAVGAPASVLAQSFPSRPIRDAQQMARGSKVVAQAGVKVD